ncbi:hypothetical protein STAFG_2897 [Streptomyces afghaniensis 772]|uniref:Uncharacterized protein n=1 Tax=Streptomyces afghaniensis 772 TaxID=1283301 RepID=S4MW13_9ACTN|nr:hypothetical protein STAFG_2897 [Streptomyces afghaniensis 772]
MPVANLGDDAGGALRDDLVQHGLGPRMGCLVLLDCLAVRL